jgi:very-short-patch-repair endonuclease
VQEEISSVYKKKAFLFDTRSEYELFKLLTELVGDTYYIFPQVHYSHLLEPKKAEWKEERRHRSRIDRKSADFVLCDKVRVVPQLIIELDGAVHGFASKQKRDEFINEITKVVGLPILHLDPKNISKELVLREIENKLHAMA